MTERLAALMREETDTLHVPPPDVEGILGAGRRINRRRRAVELGSVIAVVAVVASVTTVAALRVGTPEASDLPVASAEELEGWAVASGSTVQLGNGRTAAIDGAVKSVYYTSAGVLVRSGTEATTDAADSTYTLVTAEGAASDFELDLGERVPGTDPTQPYLAYAEPTDRPDRWDVVLRDIRTGEVAEIVTVPGTFTWGGWVAPPVALAGDHVYVGMDEATLDVDWTRGTVEPSSVLPASTMPTVAAGREVIEKRNGATNVVDVRTGEVLLATEDRDLLLSLSPDGRHAIAVPWRTCDDSGTCVYDEPHAVVYGVDTGRRITIDVRDASYGWTPRGDLLRVDEDSVDVCDPDSNVCHSTPVEVGDRDLRLGGRSYEA